MTEEKIKQIIHFMDMLLEDTSVPKNIRKAVADARAKLMTQDDIVVRASSAIYSLNEISEDINMPMHARTQIWSIVSMLETIRGE